MCRLAPVFDAELGQVRRATLPGLLDHPLHLATRHADHREEAVLAKIRFAADLGREGVDHEVADERETLVDRQCRIEPLLVPQDPRDAGSAESGARREIVAPVTWVDWLSGTPGANGKLPPLGGQP